MTLFSDPFVQAIVIDREDSSIQWKFTAPDYPFLTGCSINYEMGLRVPVFTLSFDIPYEHGIKLFQQPTPFKTGNYVKARIGYSSGNWTPWAVGFLANGGDGLSIDANGVSGSISIQGVAESSGYKIDKNVLRNAGWDPIKILKACANGIGTELIISNGASSALNSYKLIGESRGKAIRKKTYDFVSGLINLSYWEIIKKICLEWNLESWIGPKAGIGEDVRNLFVYTKAEVLKGVDQDSDVRTYMIRGIIDENNLTYPCFSWSPESSPSAWMASSPDPAAHGVNISYIDKDTGEIVEDSLVPEDQPVPVVGVISDNTPTDVEHDGIKEDISKSDNNLGEYFSAPVVSQSTDMVKKLLETRHSQGNAAQSGTITTIGLPYERPGNLCKLRGAGLIYDGLYQIRKMSHTFAPGSWEMSLVVQRYGKTIKSGEQKETKEGQMN